MLIIKNIIKESLSYQNLKDIQHKIELSLSSLTYFMEENYTGQRPDIIDLGNVVNQYAENRLNRILDTG